MSTIRKKPEFTAEDATFKEALHALVEQSGYSVWNFAALLHLPSSSLSAWIDPDDEALPSKPVYAWLRFLIARPDTLGFFEAEY